MSLTFGLDYFLAEQRQREYRAEVEQRRLFASLERSALPRTAPARASRWQADAVTFLAVCLATAAAYVRRWWSYAIDVIRRPIYPLLYYATLLLTYRIAGRATVDGVDAAGFLLVGTLGVMLWQSNLWASGYAIETERQEGTLPALLLTPSSRAAVVLGYGLGSMVTYIAPTLLAIAPVAVLAGVRLQARHPDAVVVAALALVAATMALGYALAGLFVLTRRANLLANFLQSPVYLLSGMVVPVAALPGPLRWLGEVFPISFGMTALRSALLAGAPLGDVAGALLRLLVASAVLVVVGTYLLRRVEHVAKRGSELDLV